METILRNYVELSKRADELQMETIINNVNILDHDIIKHNFPSLNITDGELDSIANYKNIYPTDHRTKLLDIYRNYHIKVGGKGNKSNHKKKNKKRKNSKKQNSQRHSNKEHTNRSDRGHSSSSSDKEHSPSRSSRGNSSSRSERGRSSSRSEKGRSSSRSDREHSSSRSDRKHRSSSSERGNSPRRSEREHSPRHYDTKQSQHNKDISVDDYSELSSDTIPDNHSRRRHEEVHIKPNEYEAPEMPHNYNYSDKPRRQSQSAQSERSVSKYSPLTSDIESATKLFGNIANIGKQSLRHGFNINQLKSMFTEKILNNDELYNNIVNDIAAQGNVGELNADTIKKILVSNFNEQFGIGSYT